MIAEEIARNFMLSQLVQAKALAILLEAGGRALAFSPEGAQIAEIIEDIGNVYLDLAEGLALLRAQFTAGSFSDEMAS